MKITTENGRVHKLSETAVLELLCANTADKVDDVFEGFAPHILKQDRYDVWLAVDNI